MKVELDQGSGRAFVLVVEHDYAAATLLAALQALSKRARVIVVRCPRVDDNNWPDLSADLLALLQTLEVRQASLVAAAAATALAQNLALIQPKLVRTLVLVDPVVRPHQTFFARIADRIEQILPLGLPLRVASRAFDVRPHLQRLRCPVLVVLSATHTRESQLNADLIAQRLPTGWVLQLSQSEFNSTFPEILLEFQDVPARCPQKGLRSSAALNASA
ncbi:MAG: hypothetical protein K1X79_05010 [Oligoflexia bacterium]|nr:hypothetical protein [Oligoflexia bacterium]